ncbi:hypothetical protein ANN_23961, partial [Periplaneta americana]
MARNTLTMADRIKIITLMEQNMRQVDVANILHVNQSIVSRLWRKFQETQSIADRPREGRPRKTTPGQDRYVRLSARRNPIASATTLREATVLLYYLNGRKARLEDFVSPDVLNVLACQISAVLKVTTGIPLPIWLSETGSAYGGGTAGLSDRYVAGFLWLDKLGMAARLGLDVVMRQSLYGSNYGLVDKDLEPLPDWWISVLYKKLVGPVVLGMDTDNILHTKCEGEQGHVRLYCHCARQHGAVTLFGMNLLNQEAHVTLTGLPFAKSVLAYVLTADIILKSRHILLNGKELQLNPDGSLPEFEPKVLNISKPLIMPVFSMAFWVIEDVYAPACHRPSKAVPASLVKFNQASSIIQKVFSPYFTLKIKDLMEMKNILAVEPPKPMQMVVLAITDLLEPNGPTRNQIVKYIMSLYPTDASKLKQEIDTALKQGVTQGILRTNRGRYQLEDLEDGTMH